jgi:trimeric autotransporter adhesin
MKLSLIVYATAHVLSLSLYSMLEPLLAQLQTAANTSSPPTVSTSAMTPHIARKRQRPTQAATVGSSSNSSSITTAHLNSKASLVRSAAAGQQPRSGLPPRQPRLLASSSARNDAAGGSSLWGSPRSDRSAFSGVSTASAPQPGRCTPDASAAAYRRGSSNSSTAARQQQTGRRRSANASSTRSSCYTSTGSTAASSSRDTVELGCLEWRSLAPARGTPRANGCSDECSVISSFGLHSAAAINASSSKQYRTGMQRLSHGGSSSTSSSATRLQRASSAHSSSCSSDHSTEVQQHEHEHEHDYKQGDTPEQQGDSPYDGQAAAALLKVARQQRSRDEGRPELGEYWRWRGKDSTAATASTTATAAAKTVAAAAAADTIAAAPAAAVAKQRSGSKSRSKSKSDSSEEASARLLELQRMKALYLNNTAASTATASVPSAEAASASSDSRRASLQSDTVAQQIHNAESLSAQQQSAAATTAATAVVIPDMQITETALQRVQKYFQQSIVSGASRYDVVQPLVQPLDTRPIAASNSSEPVRSVSPVTARSDYCGDSVDALMQWTRGLHSDAVEAAWS